MYSRSGDVIHPLLFMRVWERDWGGGGGGGGGGFEANLPMTSHDHKSTHYQFSPYMVPLDPPLVPIGALTV